ncbi:MAG TPA: UPF0175 family protein [Phycisphaerales bacterium]|nr:UPF0175 family protein [Phycisphaerales bacterium]
MDVSVTIPSEVEAALRAAGLEPAAAFREAALVQLYRDQVLTGPQLQAMLGVGRLELDDLLKRHNVFNVTMTTEELARELQALDADAATMQRARAS